MGFSRGNLKWNPDPGHREYL